MPTLRIEPSELTSAIAQRLIASLNVELSSTYPEPGATHFHLDPAQVALGAGVFLIARRDDEAVGCGALRCIREPGLARELGGNVGELKRMYVARDVRGRGIGRAILDRLEAEARALGLRLLVLETGTRQVEALSLYASAGYVTREPYGEYKASPATSVCLEKRLR